MPESWVKALLNRSSKLPAQRPHRKRQPEASVPIRVDEPIRYVVPQKISPEDIAAALGIKKSALSNKLPMEMINAGLNTLLVPVTKLQDEIRLRPSQNHLKEFCEQNGIDILLTFCIETAEKSNFAHTRVFAPKFGYLEDPATGSGNSAFGYYLLKNSHWQGEPINVEQGGDAMPAYNLVHLMTLDGNVLFGGRATDRIRGEYFL